MSKRSNSFIYLFFTSKHEFEESTLDVIRVFLFTFTRYILIADLCDDLSRFKIFTPSNLIGPQKLFGNLSDKVHNSVKIFVFLGDPARRSFPPHSLLSIVHKGTEIELSPLYKYYLILKRGIPWDYG